MFITYAIYNTERDKIYIGQTANLEKRLAHHNHLLPNKSSSYISRYSGRWDIIYTGDHLTRREALTREKELKS